MDREFDVVVWGATGFTGRLVAEYLHAQYGVSDGLRWAVGGRSESKLAALKESLGAQDLPVVLADGNDEASVTALAGRTRVVCTTVGPYALYGSKLVAACAAGGTHYCDLAGEVHWMRRMIDAHHAEAEASGARIVHSCGFDSIPSDLGVLYLQQEMLSRHGAYARAVKLRVKDTRGGFSGGTAASMMNMLAEAERDPGVLEVLADPYGLNPDGERRGLDGPERATPDFDPDFGAWTAPFVMGQINTKVVRRSHALAGYPYGRDFRYDEAVLTGLGPWGFPLALAISAGSSLMSNGAQLAGVRSMLARLLPEPGSGPSQQTRESGYFDLVLLGKHPDSRAQDLKLRVRGRGDPGYGSTSRMLGESAVCLARDDLASGGGVLTPAVAMGDALRVRLTERAQVTFEVEG